MFCNFRAIDTHALIGNIGGYVGLCLGYSFLQIPELLTVLFCKIKKLYITVRQRATANMTANLRVVYVAEYQNLESVSTAGSDMEKRDVNEMVCRGNNTDDVDSRIVALEKMILLENKKSEEKLINKFNKEIETLRMLIHESRNTETMKQNGNVK